jgi:hypothetical protein
VAAAMGLVSYGHPGRPSLVHHSNHSTNHSSIHAHAHAHSAHSARPPTPPLPGGGHPGTGRPHYDQSSGGGGRGVHGGVHGGQGQPGGGPGRGGTTVTRPLPPGPGRPGGSVVGAGGTPVIPGSTGSTGGPMGGMVGPTMGALVGGAMGGAMGGGMAHAMPPPTGVEGAGVEATGACGPPPMPRGPPLRTPSGGGLPRPGTGTSATYAQAKHAQLTLKDLGTARKLMIAEIDFGGECAQSALKVRHRRREPSASERQT